MPTSDPLPPEALTRLHEQREWLRVTLGSIGDAVIATDPAGRVVFLNPVAQSLTGWTQSESEGQALEKIFPILHEQTRQPVENPVAKVMQTGIVVGLGNHTLLVARDGTERPIDDSAAPIRDESGHIIGVVLIFRDETEERRAAQAVRQSEARKAAILATALDCILTIDHQGRILEFNPAAEKTFGYRRDEAVGAQVADLIIPPALRKQHYQGMARYLETGEGPILNRRIEITALRADGSEFPIELAITAIATDGPPLFTAYLRDLTERKRVERRRVARLAVTQILAQAATVPEAASGILQVVCENLGWDVGVFWSVQAETQGLHCKAIWHTAALAVGEFVTACRERAFKPGIGLPGRIWTTGQSAWVPDVEQDSNFPRIPAALRHGLRGAFGFPILHGKEVLGVIEFFSRQVREPDADLLEMMTTIGDQIGQFMQRKTTEERLLREAQKTREAEERLRRMVESVRDYAIFALDTQGRITSWNTGAERVFGHRGEDILGQEGAILFTPEDRQQGAPAQELARAAVSGFSEDERWHLRKDGSRFFASGIATPIRDDRGNLTGFTKVARDITQRKRAEQANRFLADASKTLAALVDYQSTLQKVASLAVPFYADWCSVDMLEPDGSLRRLAVAHVDPAKVALAHELHRRYPPDPSAPQGVWHILRTGQSEMIAEIQDALLVETVPDEELLRILRELGLKSYMGVPLRARDKTLGAITFIAAESGRRYDAADLAVAEDLAHRAAIAIENAQLYQELRQTDRRKDEFLAMLAHELRNPLAPVRNGLQILKLPGADRSTLDKARAMMERQVNHMTRIVDDLLDVSRITQGKIVLRTERLDLGRLVRVVTEDARPAFETAALAVELDLPEVPLWVMGDATRLTQVLENLLQNAIKFTNPGGSVSVGVRADADQRQAVLTVRDTGIGIEPGTLPRLFETFAQADRSLARSKGGLGLGLALVKGLVELHGGEVHAVSAGLGMGTEFAVRLPLEPEPAALSAPPGTPQRPAERLSILVIEDNRDAAESLRILLELHGYEVTVAYTGPDGVKAAERCRPNVILCDIGLPGLDGYGVAGELRRKAATVQSRLIAVTGYGSVDDQRRSREVGFDAHLVKPVDPDALLDVLAPGRPASPAAASTSPQPEPRTPSPSRAGPRCRVLVVDDNVDAAESLALLLRIHGQEVQVAHDGPTALALATTYRPDMVFLDIGMPGMDGHEVCRRLRQQPDMDRVRLIALTGWGQEEDRRRSAEAGFDHHLVKPVEPAALERVLAGMQARTEGGP